MNKLLSCLAAGLICLSWMGCSRQVATETDGTAAATESTTVETGVGNIPREDLGLSALPVGLTRETSPDQIVAAFLEALRNGDSGVAEALLTSRAREETRKENLTVQPQGSPEATFTIGQPHYLGDEKKGSHVNTTWTETVAGEVIQYDILWALRRQNSGWRVAGMGARPSPSQPIVYLNFEDPTDMLDKWREAEESVVVDEAADNGVRQARSPSPAGSQLR